MYKKYRDLWQLPILATLGKNPDGTKIHTYLIIIRFTGYRARLFDYGNLVGGSKPIPDTLKAFGWIKDDSPKWISESYFQTKGSARDEQTGLILGDEYRSYAAGRTMIEGNGLELPRGFTNLDYLKHVENQVTSF